MADTLKTLVRLAKHKVEKAQEALGEAEQKALEIAQWLQSTEASRVQALEAASGLDNVAGMLDAARYSDRLRVMAEKLRTDLMAAEVVVSERRAVLAAEYAAQERYNLLDNRQQEQVKKRRADAQQRVLDEIAGSVYARRRRED